MEAIAAFHADGADRARDTVHVSVRDELGERLVGQHVDRRGRIGQRIDAQRVQVDLVGAQALDVVERLASKEDAVGDVQHVIRLVVGPMHLEQPDGFVHLGGEPESGHDVVRRADAPVANRSDPLTKLVGGLAAPEHRTPVGPRRAPKPARDLSLPPPELLSSLELHLKGPLGILVECRNPLNTRPFR